MGSLKISKYINSHIFWGSKIALIRVVTPKACKISHHLVFLKLYS